MGMVAAVTEVHFVGLCFEEKMKTDWVGLHLGVGWVEVVVKMR